MKYQYFFADGKFHFKGADVHLQHTNFFKLSDMVRRLKLGSEAQY